MKQILKWYSENQNFVQNIVVSCILVPIFSSIFSEIFTRLKNHDKWPFTSKTKISLNAALLHVIFPIIFLVSYFFICFLASAYLFEDVCPIITVFVYTVIIITLLIVIFIRRGEISLSFFMVLVSFVITGDMHKYLRMDHLHILIILLSSIVGFRISQIKIIDEWLHIDTGLSIKIKQMALVTSYMMTPLLYVASMLDVNTTVSSFIGVIMEIFSLIILTNEYKIKEFSTCDIITENANYMNIDVDLINQNDGYLIIKKQEERILIPVNRILNIQCYESNQTIYDKSWGYIFAHDLISIFHKIVKF